MKLSVITLFLLLCSSAFGEVASKDSERELIYKSLRDHSYVDACQNQLSPEEEDLCIAAGLEDLMIRLRDMTTTR